MATVTRFEDLTSWQKARDLNRLIYEISVLWHIYVDPDYEAPNLNNQRMTTLDFGLWTLDPGLNQK